MESSFAPPSQLGLWSSDCRSRRCQYDRSLPPPNLRGNDGQLQPRYRNLPCLEAHVGTHLRNLSLRFSNRHGRQHGWLCHCGQWRCDWSFPTRNHPSLLPNYLGCQSWTCRWRGCQEDWALDEWFGHYSKWSESDRACPPKRRRNRWASLGPWIAKRRDGNRKNLWSLWPNRSPLDQCDQEIGAYW